MQEEDEIIETERLYSCDVDVLYDAANLGWDHYDADQPKFELKSERFTRELSTEARNAIKAAEALPDNATRQLAAKNALTEMKRLNPRIRVEWQYLEFYIRKAYPTTAEAELDSAGYSYFTQAGNDQWLSTENLVKKAKAYMTKNLAKLLENRNMPAGFSDAFATLGDEFIAQRKIRNLALGNSKTGTTDKVVANNAIYLQLINMLEMGKLINRNNPTEYKKFVFDELKKYGKGNKPAGAKGMVKADGTFSPIANALLSARNLNPDAPQQMYSTTTDKDGKFFLEMASGNYEITVAAEGFADMLIAKFKVSVGTKSRLNLVLAAVSAASERLADAVQTMSNGEAAAPVVQQQMVENGVG